MRHGATEAAITIIEGGGITTEAIRVLEDLKATKALGDQQVPKDQQVQALRDPRDQQVQQVQVLRDQQDPKVQKVPGVQRVNQVQLVAVLISIVD
jgi:alanine dehydrogenase